MEPGFALSGIDTTKPHPARMYDAYLGGKDNYAADREAVRQVLRAAPELRDTRLGIDTGRVPAGHVGLIQLFTRLETEARRAYEDLGAVVILCEERR